MSSRMGDFKPMLSIGSISIAQRVVATFRQAGIRRIVMVTGFNAVTLERHLSGSGVIFLRIGSELNCDKAFSDHLLCNRAKDCRNARAVSELIANTRVF